MTSGLPHSSATASRKRARERDVRAADAALVRKLEDPLRAWVDGRVHRMAEAGHSAARVADLARDSTRVAAPLEQPRARLRRAEHDRAGAEDPGGDGALQRLRARPRASAAPRRSTASARARRSPRAAGRGRSVRRPIGSRPVSSRWKYSVNVSRPMRSPVRSRPRTSTRSGYARAMCALTLRGHRRPSPRAYGTRARAADTSCRSRARRRAAPAATTSSARRTRSATSSAVSASGEPRSSTPSTIVLSGSARSTCGIEIRLRRLERDVRRRAVVQLARGTGSRSAGRGRSPRSRSTCAAPCRRRCRRARGRSPRRRTRAPPPAAPAGTARRSARRRRRQPSGRAAPRSPPRRTRARGSRSSA